MTLDELKEVVSSLGLEDAVLLDDFSDAYIGTTSDDRVAYSYPRMVEVLVSRGMDYEEAVDYISYNTLRALPYAGPKAPVVVFCEDFAV